MVEDPNFLHHGALDFDPVVVLNSKRSVYTTLIIGTNPKVFYTYSHTEF